MNRGPRPGGAPFHSNGPRPAGGSFHNNGPRPSGGNFHSGPRPSGGDSAGGSRPQFNRTPRPQPAPISGDQAFEDKLKQFLSSSEGKMADLNRNMDGKRGRRRK